MATNRVARLARRPRGMVTRGDFDIRDEPLAEPADGEFRVRVSHVSIDPAMRGWMNDARSYAAPVKLGDVMRALAVGHVEASRHRAFKDGDAVSGIFGVQRYAISDGSGVSRVDETLAPMPTWLGGLGMPGLTAYFGLYDVARPEAGETVVVSAASGAVGQVVGQLAKMKGCRAVGIAGGPEKCRMVTEEFGFDAAVDYRAGDLAGQLEAACPSGIDVDFENVGGEVFDTVLAHMNPFGRIALCGLISSYNATEVPAGPANIRYVLTMRLRMQGFIVSDFAARYGEAIGALSGWVKEDRLRFVTDVREGGVDAYPDVLNLLYTSGNRGKLVLAL
ncbi:MAG: NADP-dependent oxidoreductase [Acidobacteriota bacterium]|nr:NADP-dependent oxidoreductase [Acidobacteriota bacterium]